MTLETAVGLMFVALTTGLVFARFSRPTARVLFSSVAVVGPYNGVPTLSIRIANQRKNQMLAAEVSMTLVRDELSDEGELSRRFYDLALVRDFRAGDAVTPIVLYQRLISPAIPRRCKYEPTCSRYAVEAIREYGILRGLVLAGWRLLRCNPWSYGGYDPVQAQRVFRIEDPTRGPDHVC